MIAPDVAEKLRLMVTEAATGCAVLTKVHPPGSVCAQFLYPLAQLTLAFSSMMDLDHAADEHLPFVPPVIV